LYGAGGGGGGASGNNYLSGGAGGQGLIVITYTPLQTGASFLLDFLASN
jgi:hypothetical protein